MLIYVILFISCLFLALFVKRTQVISYNITREQMVNRVCLGGIFSLLFVVSSFRIGIGNDYWQYRTYFNAIYKGQEDTLEWGFHLIVLFVQKIFGYDQYRILFALFAALTLWFFLKGMYEQSESFALSFFFFFSLGNYLNSFTTVRYYLALAIALYSVKYVLRADWIKFIFWIILAAMFHKSVLFVIPVYFIAALPWKKWFYFLLPVFSFALYLMPEVFRRLVFLFYPYYEGALFDVPHISYVNIARSAGTLVLVLLFYKQIIKNNIELQFYHHLNMLALILFTCASYIPEVSRIGYYLNIGQIFLIPGILLKIPQKKIRILLLTLIVLAFILYFFLFLNKAQQIDIRMVPYRSWLFEDISNY